MSSNIGNSFQTNEKCQILNETLTVLDAALGTSRSQIFNATSNLTNEKENTNMDLSYLCDITVPRPINLTMDNTLNQTSAVILAQEDPGNKAAQVLFSEFVNIFISYPSDTLIWEEISAYERACAQQANSLMNVIRKVPRHHSHFTKTEQMAIRLKEERNTWRLLGSLYYERLNDDIVNDDFPLIETSKDRTDKAIISQLYEKSYSIREAQNIIDWLEKNAEDDNERKYFDQVDYFGNTHIAWENTLRVTKNEKEQQKTGLCGSMYGLGGLKPLITSLDPDAPLRQSKPLHDLDQDEDQRLVRCMFSCLRAGQLSEAQELCAKSGQHWRAAALEGWKLFHDPNPDDSRSRNPVIGNQYRDVWKAMAWSAANDARLSKEERAVYGALCGHLPALLQICTSWEDQLWAYFRTFVDQRVEETLRDNSLHLRSLHPLPKDYPEEKLTKEGIFRDIETSLVDKNQTMYNVVQKFLILNDIDGLVTTSHEWINREDPVSPHLLRCLTHLLLILRRFGAVSYELNDKVTDILHACVKDAMERGDVEQVARYASILPDWLQVRCYASFLLNICDEPHRKHALHLASTVGLDTPAITTTVVAKIRLEPEPDSSSDIIADTNAEDKNKINALDWLLYDRNQRPEALRQANAMIRHFLISRKMGAAKTLFHKIPADSIDVTMKQHEAKTGSTDLPMHLENRVREYLCFRTFLDAQESFTDWFDHFHQKKPTAPRKPKSGCSFTEQLAYDHSQQQYESDLEKWKNTLNLITKKASERLYNVLLFPDGGWLVDVSPLTEEEMDSDGGPKRALDMSPEDARMLQFLEEELVAREPNREHQLTTLRSIYVPQVTSLLQNILHSTENYKECIQLSDMIASKKHSLYKCFGTGEMQRFLFKLQETSKELLDKNFDALGYKLH